MVDDRNANDTDADAGESLPLEAAAALAAWATSDPPAGFVDRVIAAARQDHATPAPARYRRSLGAAVVAVIAVAASLMLLRDDAALPDEGARVIQDRETISLGGRGVAVAEPGTEITWTVSATGSAEVHQTHGDVFYRVENGGPFVVETPHGRIIVRGTCFRVEVLDMSVSRQTWIGGAVGAALAATVVIAVYEGRVRVVNARGHADGRPGDRVALAPGIAPTRLGPGASEAGVASVEPPPPGSATLPELLRRDQSHRGEIALLRARVRALETAGPEAEAALARDHRDGKRAIIDISHDELAEMAKNCEIRFDIPGYGIEPRLMDDKLAEADQLSADDRAIYDQTVRKENDRYMTALRALYQELGGGDAGNLDTHALFSEILHKSPTADFEAARKQLAEERAGLTAPPADLRNRSVVERMLRLEISAGSTLEQLLAAELGAGKAHQIRKNGWAGLDNAILHGCPD